MMCPSFTRCFLLCLVVHVQRCVHILVICVPVYGHSLLHLRTSLQVFDFIDFIGSMNGVCMFKSFGRKLYLPVCSCMHHLGKVERTEQLVTHLETCKTDNHTCAPAFINCEVDSVNCRGGTRLHACLGS
jgi:hypothetical protein